MDWSLIIGVGIGFLGSLIVQVVSQRHQSREAREDRKAARNLELLKERFRVYGVHLPILVKMSRDAANYADNLINEYPIDKVYDALGGIMIVASEQVRITAGEAMARLANPKEYKDEITDQLSTVITCIREELSTTDS